MTTAGDPNLIYCVKCKAKTESSDLKAGHHEERPRRGPGHLRCLRRQEDALRRHPPAVNAGPVVGRIASDAEGAERVHQRIVGRCPPRVG